jgi:LysM repeat protein
MSMNNGPELFEYTIQSDDTLWDLAEEYSTSVEDIVAVNADLDPDSLYVGQVIYLPYDSQLDVSQRPPFRRRRRPFRRRPFTCRRYYVVRPGDTLYRISFRFNVPVRSIVAANPYINFGYPLQIGQNICIP